MRTHTPLAVALALGCLVAVTGCQQAPPAVDMGPQLDAYGQRRSLALDTPLQAHLESRQYATQALPWYADRNDCSPAATSGYALPTVQSSVTITRDRQYNSHGRVRDDFQSTTYRREYRQSVR